MTDPLVEHIEATLPEFAPTPEEAQRRRHEQGNRLAWAEAMWTVYMGGDLDDDQDDGYAYVWITP